MQTGHLLFWYPEHLSSPFEDSEKKHSPVPFPPRLNFIYSEIGARGLQGLCSLPLAVAVSPSGWAMRCIAVAATQTGMLIFCPKTEVDRSITDTSLSTRGYSFHLTQRNRIKYLHHWGYSSRCPRADFPVIRRKKKMVKAGGEEATQSTRQQGVGSRAELQCVTQTCKGSCKMHKAKKK